MSREEMMAALREKLDAGYQVFMDDMLSRTPEIVFDNAATIRYNQQAYDQLYDGDCLSDEQLERLLSFKDPMQVVRERWAFWSDAVLWDDRDISGEMASALQELFEGNRAHEKSGLEDDKAVLGPEQEQTLC